jgi:hypothetical protein
VSLAKVFLLSLLTLEKRQQYLIDRKAAGSGGKTRFFTLEAGHPVDGLGRGDAGLAEGVSASDEDAW